MLSPPIDKLTAPPAPVLRRKGECGTGKSPPGPCPACGRNEARLRPKLEIGAVDDPLGALGTGTVTCPHAFPEDVKVEVPLRDCTVANWRNW